MLEFVGVLQYKNPKTPRNITYNKFILCYSCLYVSKVQQDILSHRACLLPSNDAQGAKSKDIKYVRKPPFQILYSRISKFALQTIGGWKTNFEGIPNSVRTGHSDARFSTRGPYRFTLQRLIR